AAAGELWAGNRALRQTPLFAARPGGSAGSRLPGPARRSHRPAQRQAATAAALLRLPRGPYLFRPRQRAARGRACGQRALPHRRGDIRRLSTATGTSASLALCLPAMSLRIRLTLITSLLFVCSMLLGVVLLVGSARQRVANEVASTATLSYQLLLALLPAGGANTPDDRAALLRRLQELEGARHLFVGIADSQSSLALPASADVAKAPVWFTRLVQGGVLHCRIPLDTPAGEHIIIRTNAADEMTEVWQETRRFLVLLSLARLLLNGILYFIMGQWFRPVTTILDHLGKVEAGEPGRSLPARALPALQVIARRI